MTTNYTKTYTLTKNTDKYIYKTNIKEKNNKPSKQESNLTIYLLFMVIAILLIAMTACISTFIVGNETKILLPNRTFAAMEKKQNLVENYALGVGGAYLSDNQTTPYTTLDYYIKKGDSIHSLSRKFGIDECTIIKINNIEIPSKIVRGQKIQIPNQNGIQEEVTKNNSLDVIAKKYNMEKTELMRINNMTAENNTDKIFVPGLHYDGISKQLLLGEYFSRPAYGRFTSMFGYRLDPFTKKKSLHTGVDIANKQNTKVYSAAPGKVIFVGEMGGYGNLIKIQHTSGYVSYYGHLNKFAIKAGTWVSTGTLIGYMGTTGYSTGNHLHYEIRKNNKPINPMTVTVF